MVTQQYNINTKTATFFGKSDGNAYLALAVALATWYNGRKEEAEYQELKLSDAFKKSEFSGQAALECRVIMLNINLGHNKELFENCRILWEYAYFINEVRENQKKVVL